MVLVARLILVSAGLFLTLYLTAFAATSAPKPKDSCAVAKQKALGKAVSFEVISGDAKSATKDSCVGAVYVKGHSLNPDSYKCTGERATVFLSEKGTRIESTGDAKVPEYTCVTTICEANKPCRPPKLTSGVQSSDLKTSVGTTNPATGSDLASIPGLLKSREAAEAEASKLESEKVMAGSGVGIEPWTDAKEEQLASARQRANDTQAELEKLMGDPLVADPQLEKDAAVREIWEQKVRSSDNLNALVRQQMFCQSIGGCDQFLVEGGETGGDAALAKAARKEVNEIAREAVRQTYSRDSVDKVNNEVTVVKQDPERFGDHTFNRGPELPVKNIFYDNTGKRFMESYPTTGDVALFDNGRQLFTYDESGHLAKDSIARIADTPGKFDALWRETVGRTDFEGSYKFLPYPGEGAEAHVQVTSSGGIQKTIPYTDYKTLQDVGAEVYGTRGAMERISAWTGGKYSMMEPATLAEPGSAWKYSNALASLSDLTPPSPKQYADIAQGWEKTLTALPPAFYENLDVRPTTIYTFGETSEGASLVKSGGFAYPPAWYNLFSTGENVPLWVNTTRGADDFFSRGTYHELMHSAENAFPNNDEWGREVYGETFQRAYAGQSGTEAIKNQVSTPGVVPPGFADDYGYRGGIYEDKATVGEAMFVNYPAMRKAADSDLILATKMQMVQDGFYKTSAGVMDQAWWDNLKPVSPNFVPARGNYVSKLMQGLAQRAFSPSATRR